MGEMQCLSTGSSWLPMGQPWFYPVGNVPTAHCWCCSRPWVISFHVFAISWLKVSLSFLCSSLHYFQLTGEPLIRRAEDNKKAFRKRYEAYSADIWEVKSHYQKKRMLFPCSTMVQIQYILQHMGQVLIKYKQRWTLKVSTCGDVTTLCKIFPWSNIIWRGVVLWSSLIYHM